MSLKVELLEQSFNYIKPYGNLFVSSFYENLFKASPETKSLFADLDSETKKNQLWDSLVLVVENLRQPDTLKNVLQGLGARILTYGVLPEHYPLLRDAFITTFEQFLGSEWNAEFKQAWNDSYVTFRELMLDGVEQTRKQMASITPVTELEKTQEEEAVVLASTDNSLAEDLEALLDTPVADLEETLEEEAVVVASTDNSLAEDLEELLDTPVAELEETLEEEAVVVASTDNSLAEELLDTPVAELEETLEEEAVVVASTDNSLTEELLDTPLSESADIVEEQVIIVKSTDNSPEKTTLETSMPESDNNIAKEDIMLEESEDSLEENALETPLADLTETLKSETIDPQFTQIFSPESKSESPATAVKSVASEKTYESESQLLQSKKGWLISGGVAGAIGLLLLLLL